MNSSSRISSRGRSSGIFMLFSSRSTSRSSSSTRDAFRSSSRNLLVFFVFLSLHSIAPSRAQDPSMEPEEAAAVFDVLESINYDIDWRSLFPGDNPCTGGPHGLNCDLAGDGSGDGNLHVVELNLGWVSDFVNNPPCAANASIHPSILKFKHLRKLFFYQCFYGDPMGIPREISQLGSSLQHLTFQDNVALVGPVPSSFANLTSLERLVLTENRLEGRIPPELGDLRSLQQLVLSHNRLNESIPAELGNCGNLRILDFSGNQLSGEIPPSLGSGLLSIEKIDLSSNSLEGGVPVQLSSRLRFLDLSSNNLSGGVPDESLLNLRSLQTLFLRGNPCLGGAVPVSLGSLTNLEMLSISGAGMVGSIPESIGELQRLNSLALDGNNLSGAIPRSMARLASLYHLNLSSNQLSGPLPFSQSFLSRLGRNLIVRNNTGLCHELEQGDEDLVQTLGLGQCSSSDAFDFSGTTSRHSAARIGAAGASCADFLSRSLILMISLLLLLQS